MSDYVYRLQNLERFYTNKNEIVKAVNNISLDIQEGEFVAIIGPSGSGKTTLLNLLSGLDQPTGGTILFNSKNGNQTRDFTTLSDNELCDIRRYEIGIVFQFYNMHPSFTALENIEYPMLIADIDLRSRRKRALDLITQMGLEDKTNNYPSELSGGEKQRIGIARALANDPKVIIADEPTGDMDSTSAEHIISILKDLNQNYSKTIVMVTHDESLISEEMRIIELESGRILDEKIPIKH